MTDDERLRAVEMSALSAHEKIEAHDNYCRSINKQNGRQFQEIKDAQTAIQSSLTWINRWLLGTLMTLIIAALIAYFKAAA